MDKEFTDKQWEAFISKRLTYKQWAEIKMALCATYDPEGKDNNLWIGLLNGLLLQELRKK